MRYCTMVINKCWTFTLSVSSPGDPGCRVLSRYESNLKHATWRLWLEVTTLSRPQYVGCILYSSLNMVHRNKFSSHASHSVQQKSIHTLTRQISEYHLCLFCPCVRTYCISLPVLFIWNTTADCYRQILQAFCWLVTGWLAAEKN